MILTDREINSALDNKQIDIDPRPSPDAFSSTSVDLTLSTEVRVWSMTDQAGVEPNVFCPGTDGFKVLDVVTKYSKVQVLGETGLIMKPGDFLLAWTKEHVELPNHSRFGARVEGKSSLARLGIGVHLTAPTIHAGFKGTIQLEMCNHGTLHVRIIPGMRICQLIIETTLGTPEKGYRGQFQNQTSGA